MTISLQPRRPRPFIINMSTLDRIKLNAALDYHVEHATDADPRREIIDDLMLLIAGDSNPSTTLDQMADAALRVAPHLLFLDDRED